MLKTHRMNLEKALVQRAHSQCELCAATELLEVYKVPASPTEGVDSTILCCATCSHQIQNPEAMDSNHWRCLNESMWSTVPAVQVMAWRLLHRIKGEGWPQDLLDMMYMEEETAIWADADGSNEDDSEAPVHRDSNGVVLEAGDSVLLIKDLKVKGSSMIAKQASAVRRISLDRNNEKYIEGKVDGQHIVIITDYVKKI